MIPALSRQKGDRRRLPEKKGGGGGFLCDILFLFVFLCLVKAFKIAKLHIDRPNSGRIPLKSSRILIWDPYWGIEFLLSYLQPYSSLSSSPSSFVELPLILLNSFASPPLLSHPSDTVESPNIKRLCVLKVLENTLLEQFCFVFLSISFGLAILGKDDLSCSRSFYSSDRPTFQPCLKRERGG